MRPSAIRARVASTVKLGAFGLRSHGANEIFECTPMAAAPGEREGAEVPELWTVL